MSMFGQYESMPTKVEAAQFTLENKDRIFNEMSGNKSADHENGDPILKVTTAHGETAIVRIGDWVVKEKKLGCYYPVKDEIFQERYV